MKKRRKQTMIVSLCCICFLLVSFFPRQVIASMEQQTICEVEKDALQELDEILSEHAVMGALYLTDCYQVRQEPSLVADICGSLESGQTLFLQEVVYDDAGRLWIRVTWNDCGEMEQDDWDELETEGAKAEETEAEETLSETGSTEWTGYIERHYFACSDEVFLAWEQEFGIQEDIVIQQNRRETEAEWMEVQGSSYVDVAQFPVSYQQKLEALKKSHPNWTFVKMNTKLDYQTVLSNELKEKRSLIYHNGWVQASKTEVDQCLDPRNYLTEQFIFAMEQLTFQASYHTQAGLQTFLNGTFMNGNVEDSSIPNSSDQTYAKAFFLASTETKSGTTGLQVSPYHLASRVYQEQGAGTSPLISGTYSGFEGYYNYFNVKASGNNEEEIYQNGLTYAKLQKWNTRYKSICGGAKTIGLNYILKGQDTIYLEKFDLVAPMYTHQYMQNIEAPKSEAKSQYRLYSSSGSVDSAFVFKIPVYQNMPGESDSEEPDPATVEQTYGILLTIPSGYQGNQIYVDGVCYTASKNGNQLSLRMTDGSSKMVTMYQYDKNNVPIGMFVWSLKYDETKGKYQVKEETGLKNLLSYDGFSMQIKDSPGIRMKASISNVIYQKLSEQNINGYTLLSHGMITARASQLQNDHFLMGDKNVSEHDKLYGEVIGDKMQFAYCVENIEKGRYSENYYFRSYVKLQKEGATIIVYGPILSRSVFQMAGMTLANEAYEKDSREYRLLHQFFAE